MDLIGTIEDDEELSVVESDDSEQQVGHFNMQCVRVILTRDRINLLRSLSYCSKGSAY